MRHYSRCFDVYVKCAAIPAKNCIKFHAVGITEPPTLFYYITFHCITVCSGFTYRKGVPLWMYSILHVWMTVTKKLTAPKTHGYDSLHDYCTCKYKVHNNNFYCSQAEAVFFFLLLSSCVCDCKFLAKYVMKYKTDFYETQKLNIAVFRLPIYKCGDLPHQQNQVSHLPNWTTPNGTDM